MRVWNVTHKHRALTLTIQGEQILPGKYIEVEALTKKEELLVGSCLFIGDRLPPTVPVKLKALTREECREHLEDRLHQTLLLYAYSVSPPIPNAELRSTAGLVEKLLGVIFSKKHSKDPTVFFWTGQWERVGSVYRELE